MRKIFKITIMSMLLFFVNCQKEEMFENKSNDIDKLITSFDNTLQKFNSNNQLSEGELNVIFIEECKEQGLEILNKNEKRMNYSKEFVLLSDQIKDTYKFDSEKDYKNYLLSIKKELNRTKLLDDEKLLISNRIETMIAFVNWMQTLEKNKEIKSNLKERRGKKGKNKGTKSKKKSWWKRWGKCVAGTLGGAITGGLGGCGIGSAAGLGFGSVPGCGVGAVVGGIGGGLTGAAASCD